MGRFGDLGGLGGLGRFGGLGGLGGLGGRIYKEVKNEKTIWFYLVFIGKFVLLLSPM